MPFLGLVAEVAKRLVLRDHEEVGTAVFVEVADGQSSAEVWGFPGVSRSVRDVLEAA